MADIRALGPPFYEDSLMPDKNPAALAALSETLGHVFARPDLLHAALTHPSVASGKARKKKTSSPYERLEFLGDRVLGLVIAQALYELYPEATEGELAKRHASLVNRDALKIVALEIDLGNALRLAQGEDAQAERKNLATLSDAMEAVIGALYLDGGLPPAERFINRLWKEALRKAHTPADPKTALQEWAQGNGLPLPVYKVLDRSGPAHAPHFEMEVSVKGREPASASGHSKREAEKAAARALLERIESE